MASPVEAPSRRAVGQGTRQGIGAPRLAALPLFRGLGEAALAAIAAELEWVELPGGTVLFREGDPAESLYVVTAGSLEVLLRTAEGDRPVAQIGVGETVGEMGLIAGAPRSATVAALRDSELVRLDKPAYDKLIAAHPGAMLQLVQILVGRLHRTTHGERATRSAKTLAFLPLSAAPSTTGFARSFVAALAAAGYRVKRLDGAVVERSSEWLHGVESDHDLVVYDGEPLATDWSRLCLRQADRVYLIQSGAVPCVASPLEPLLAGSKCRADLVLLHAADAVEPSQCAGWLSRVTVEAHHHLRTGREADLLRLVRLVTGNAVGLVLSGGSARGFAHIGALRALRQAGIPLDLFAGTSVGAIVAAGAAVGWDDDELRDRMRAAFATSNPLGDYTLPLIGLVKGRKVTRGLRTHFADRAIEDLWHGFFCLSTNLSSGRSKVHRSGPLWRALRASVAIPGVLPPVIEAGEVLVDGGTLNNFPVDVMSALQRGPVIGVNVAAGRSFASNVADLEAGSLWQLLRQVRGETPSIIRLLMRVGTMSSAAQLKLARMQADLLIEPKLKHIDPLDWRAFDRGIAAGYEETMRALEAVELPLRRKATVTAA
jgi:NTE family protein